MPDATILVVDDELFFRSLYTEILGEEGYQVETVASGRDALMRLQQGGIDVMLTDLIMPGLGGMELLRRARSLDNPPDVILATGHATLETAIEALKSGARDYLIKPFKPEELCHLVRLCVEQRRLLDENALLKSQIRLFQRGQNLASLIEIERLLPQAISTLLSELGHGRGFAFLAAQNAVTRIHGCDGIDEESATAMATLLAEPLASMGTAMLVLSRAELPQSDRWPEDVRTVAIVPLRCERSLKGALVLLNPAHADFSVRLAQDNLHYLADQAALGFENAYRYQGARDLIYTDDLTGLFNYRYLQIALEQEVRRTERYGLSFSLIFIDLDHFKDINDTRGHLAGSEALREVAMLLHKSVREVDVLFRYGGDEFTALLVETDARGAQVVAERIRQAVAQHTFLADSDAPARLTATLGYATFPEHATDKKSIIDIADRAMYEGKKCRNVVRSAQEIK